MSALDGNLGISPIIMQIEVAIDWRTRCAMDDRRLGFVLQCDTSPIDHLRGQLQPFVKRLDCHMWHGEDPWTFGLSLYDVKGWVLMSKAWDSWAHDRNEQSCH